jgi:hypothetical protein
MDESLLKSSESSSSAKVGKLGYNVGKIVMDSLLTELVDGSGTENLKSSTWISFCLLYGWLIGCGTAKVS